MPRGVFRKRSKSSQECRSRTWTPRRCSCRPTNQTVRTSRRFPTWTDPEGVIPEAQVKTTALPRFEMRSSATTLDQCFVTLTLAASIICSLGGATGRAGCLDSPPWQRRGQGWFGQQPLIVVEVDQTTPCPSFAKEGNPSSTTYNRFAI